jgi:hypothetical protein
MTIIVHMEVLSNMNVVRLTNLYPIVQKSLRKLLVKD